MIKKIKISGYRIYRNLDFAPNGRFNLIVGANESGKSTLIEAITLALTGRINGRLAAEELNPYWFNTDLVEDFVERRRRGEKIEFPAISIELFFSDTDDLQYLCGANNSEVPTEVCPGITLKVLPNRDYAKELTKWAANPSAMLPVEYYTVDWRSFADTVITSRPRNLATAVVDSRTVRSTTAIDYHLRQILGDYLEPGERAGISLAYRTAKTSMSRTLQAVNDRIGALHASLHDRPISLAMDQGPRTSWEGALTPHVDKVPFSMSGQGQQATIKISLAMSKNADRANYVMVEEPENHLAHTSLTTLLSRIESLAGEQQQLFISTHSSFVLNRLGLDALLLISNGVVRKISQLDPETVSYFQKLPGYDTLRMVLANKVVLVEGPSDEIIFERVFCDLHGRRPMECGVDVISMRGLSLKRCLQLCHALDKKVAALRDNDGIEFDTLREDLAPWLSKERRELFVGRPSDGETLEPQLIHFNGEGVLRKALKLQANADLLKWMTREKTEAALRLATHPEKMFPPPYMRAAAEFIYG